MADTLLNAPPVDFRRIVEVDVPAVARADPALAERIPMLLHSGFFEPFRELLSTARHDGSIAADVDIDLLAASVIALVEGLGSMHGERKQQGSASHKMVHDALRILMRGASIAF